MNQSKLESIVESTFNTVVGYVLAVICQVLIFPMFGINVSVSTNVAIVTIFTVISFVRVYLFRRLFNAGLYKILVKLSNKTYAKYFT